MMYNHPDGLPATIRSGLNQKVDQLLKVSRFVQFTHASGRLPLLIRMAYLFKLTLCNWLSYVVSLGSEGTLS